MTWKTYCGNLLWQSSLTLLPLLWQSSLTLLVPEFSYKFLKSMDGVCKVGDIIKVKCLDVDERGRIKLSRKAAMKELDEQAAN